ncbi:MAG: TraR/DksA family transcriptional regulator [Bdellovibrionota bacterium]
MAKKKSREAGLVELKEILMEKKKKLLEHLYKLEGESAQDIGEVHGDSADIAALEINQASLSKLGGREQKLLKKIEHALRKFEDESYGICEYSGEEIPLERLFARPEAQYTVEAKEMLERKERGFRGNVDSNDDSWLGDELD